MDSTPLLLSVRLQRFALIRIDHCDGMDTYIGTFDEMGSFMKEAQLRQITLIPADALRDFAQSSRLFRCYFISIL